MTVAALVSSIAYVENGVTAAFAAPFRYKTPTSLVADRVLASGVVLSMVYGVDYSATPGTTDAGGTVTVTLPAMAGTRLRIRRVTARSQAMDYTPSDRFPAESHELALDTAMLIDQEQDDKIKDTANRAVLVPDGEAGYTLPAKLARASLYLVFDANGDLITSRGTGSDPALRGDLADPANTLTRTKRSSLLTAAAYRTLASKVADRLDFRDMLGADITGVNDMTSTLQAAINEASSSGDTLNLPSNAIITTTAVVNVKSGASILGQRNNRPYTTGAGGGSRGAGAWLHLAHSGVGLSVADAGFFPSGIELIGFGTFRDQPVPAAAWAPNPHDFDISIAGADVLIEDFTLENPTKAILQTSGPAGRLHLRRVRGQPFDVGVQIDDSYDGFMVETLRWWPFWSNDLFTRAYTKANRRGAYLRHCDNPAITNYFDIFSKYPVYCGSHPNGVVNNANLLNPEFDSIGGTGVFFEAGSNGSYVKLLGGYTYGDTNVGAGFESLANNTQYVSVGHRYQNMNNRAGQMIAGAGNTAIIVNPEVYDWNLANAGLEAFAATPTNRIFLEGSIKSHGGNGAALINNVGLIASQEIVTVNALSVTAQTGVITTSSATTDMQRGALWVKGRLSVTVTTNGTGAGDLRVGLPVSVAAGKTYYGTGRNTSTGLQVQCVFNGSNCIILTPGNTYPIASGQTIEVNLDYGCVAL